MKIHGIRNFLWLSLLVFALLFTSCNQEKNEDCSWCADMVVANATIYTSDPENPWADTLAIRDGRFVYVGNAGGLKGMIGKKTQVIDGAGRWLTPGFVDNHCHPIWMGSLFAVMLSMYDTETFDQIKDGIQGYVAANLDVPFVIAIGWTFGHLEEGQEPTAELADEIISDRPLFLWGAGGHAGWVNTAALTLMKQRNPEAFEALEPFKDDDGNDTGQILHFYAFNPFDYFTEEEVGSEMIEGMAMAAGEVIAEGLKLGVTAMNDVQIYKTFLPFLETYEELGVFDNARVRLSYYIGPERKTDMDALSDDIDAWMEWGASMSDDHLSAGDSVKLYIDGVPGNYTSFMSEEYTNMPGEHGQPLWSQEEFDEVADMLDKKPVQICTHGIGDAGVERIINSYAKVQEENGAWDSRHRIEHVEFIMDKDVERMGEYGIYAAVQPSHFLGGDDLAIEVLGIERLKTMMPWKSMEDAGVNLSFGSDWVAAPFGPYYGLVMSTIRMNYMGEFDWAPEQAVDLYSALSHYTIDSAKALKWEKEIGSIEVGKFADFVIHNMDISTINTLEFLEEYGFDYGTYEDFVDMTVVGGNVVYEREAE